MSPISVAMLPKSSACKLCPYTLPTQVLRTILLCYKRVHTHHTRQKGSIQPSKSCHFQLSVSIYSPDHDSVLGPSSPPKGAIYTIQKSCSLCTYGPAHNSVLWGHPAQQKRPSIYNPIFPIYIYIHNPASRYSPDHTAYTSIWAKGPSGPQQKTAF